MYFRIAGKDVHIPKLIGAFVLFAAFLMFVQVSAQMFDSWDNMKAIKSCLAQADANNKRMEPGPDIFPTCQDISNNSVGLYLRPGQTDLSSRQLFSVLLGPIAGILFWLAILFIGYVLYRTGDIVLPIEEKVTILSDTPQKPQRKKKKR